MLEIFLQPPNVTDSDCKSCRALKYLTFLAKEVLSHPSDDPESKCHPGNEEFRSEEQTPKKRKGRGTEKLISSDCRSEFPFRPGA